MKKLFLLCFILTVLVIADPVQAKTAITKPKILPSHPLYRIKLLGEEMKERFIFNDQKKLEYRLRRSSERVSEMNELAGQIMLKGSSSVKGESTVNFDSKITLTTKEMLKEADKHLGRMEGASAGVRKMLEEARTSRDVVRTLCLNDKLSQMDVAIRSAKDRRSQLAAAVGSDNRESASHEFTIITVLRQRIEQLAAEANQCIGEEGAFIGKSEVVTRIDPALPDAETGDRPFSPQDPPPYEAPPPFVSASAIFRDNNLNTLGDEKLLTFMRTVDEQYQEIMNRIVRSIGENKNWDSTLQVMETAVAHEKALGNLAPLVPPSGADRLLYLEEFVRDIAMKGYANAAELGDERSIALARELIDMRTNDIVRTLRGTHGLTQVKDTEKTPAAFHLNGVPIEGLTADILRTNLWLTDGKYQSTLAETSAEQKKEDYINLLNSHDTHLFNLPLNTRTEKQAYFGSTMFDAWVSFMRIKAETNRSGIYVSPVSALTGITRQYEDIAVANVAKDNPEAAAGLLMGFMDKEIKILTDGTGKPYQIHIPDALSDYQQKLTAVAAMVHNPEMETVTPHILLVNEELLKRGVIHAAYLTYIQDKSTDSENVFISGVVTDLSKSVKTGVAIIKEYDPEEYKAHQAAYQGLSQGLSQGLMQGMSQGIAQGLSQGISQGMSQGLQQGITQGIGQGLLQGLQYATGSALPRQEYENLWDLFVDPPSATDSALGFYQYISIGSGDDFGGGDDFSGGDDFGSGDDYLGGDDFGSGDDYGSGDDFGGGSDFNTGIHAIIAPITPGLIQKESQGLYDYLKDYELTPTPTTRGSVTPTSTTGYTSPHPVSQITPTPQPASSPVTSTQPIQPTSPPNPPTQPPSTQTTQPPEPTAMQPPVLGESLEEPWWISVLRYILNVGE